MTALTWALRLIIFVLLVVFAAQNTDPVSLRLLPGKIWQAPLILALLAFFVGGVILGALSLLGVLFRQRREISRLKKEATRKAPVANVEVPPAV
ncbi:lipopolysaccharide assembly protein LapA domain-containing protein [Dechloromonas sp. XY25]|uniref:Lipopolysaccharide assembly protein LapA domain-containing protein n=1 Tax=Dechloromonas hankyongensis TaxID=2908002 RepID=A0ABS9K205_9RHOO|nr:lipopolysaccharide assembly protein LapA domain-containing protein [Dechloromonas hankyongensis]MCG2577119.1 lipopolysaccharide assembly protein LapA domain-containing protein [Dechloromonas hankyongensis]